ncbi:uncharacterized protein HHUB_4146 (plasmid) [Halobacterium hubeiense]|uniref:Uncharacterized protein n=1 Tax=Halobacterium hubeiense TaxID=1407499 RepID=A0A0U5H9M5_9EURY|nr:uncharacterized protein HHUB_4146 [Halobacterium hubeiense]
MSLLDPQTLARSSRYLRWAADFEDRELRNLAASSFNSNLNSAPIHWLILPDHRLNTSIPTGVDVYVTATQTLTESTSRDSCRIERPSGTFQTHRHVVEATRPPQAARNDRDRISDVPL